MPTTYDFAEDGEFEIPESICRIDVVCDARGGRGGDSDPVQERGGGGGGQGGHVEMAGISVQPGQRFAIWCTTDAGFMGPIGNVTYGANALPGSAADGSSGGSGGGGYGGTVTIGATGEDGTVNGGNGGGSSINAGTTDHAPFPSGKGQGGGGQGYNGPGNGGSGGPPRIGIVCYQAENS